MIKIVTNGFVGVEPYNISSLPLFLTNEFEVIEGPTLWVAQVALRRSRSDRTLKCYSNNLEGFLKWLDEKGYKADQWQNVDEDIINSYITSLIERRDSKGKPDDNSIESYIARIADFYKWASDNGYEHFWRMKRDRLRRTIKDIGLRDITIEVERREIKLGGGQSTGLKKEVEKFLDDDAFKILLRLLDDLVYKVMAVIIRIIGARPKGLLQLPYLGVGPNAGLRRYREHELNNLEDIPFTFKSKGKYQTIPVPGELWQFICLHWMPERQKRAELYRQRWGVSPPNNVLFLSEDGTPVTYKMLHSHFGKVASHPDFPRDRMTPYMLRHAFATYFVLRHLQAMNRLEQPYVYDVAVDDELRKFMGHNDINTTYKHYVHLVNRFVRDDLIYDLQKHQTKEILSGFFESAKLS
jgi:site-specific recombinase XerD